MLRGCVSMTTIIIGAGASGLACAVRLKMNNPQNEVIVLERLSQAGRKLLATGNGRCNLTNTASPYYETAKAFFDSIGLVTKADSEGRVYPYSNQASTVAEMLEEKCRALGAQIITDCTVYGIDRSLTVESSKGIFMADNVVIAAGGKAQKALGSDGSGYALLGKLGHHITPLSPALVQLTSPSKYPRALKGHRVKCNMSILLDGRESGSEYGEVLFTDYGLSGIVTMNLSHIVGKNFVSDAPQKCHAVLDLIPEMCIDELKKYLERFGSFKGILGKKLSDIIEKQADGDIDKMIRCAKSWKLIITGTKGYNFAQITSGGASLDEFDNFKSKLVDGLYACGEILDKQFACGGFNLSFAWYSAVTAADSISNMQQNI